MNHSKIAYYISSGSSMLPFIQSNSVLHINQTNHIVLGDICLAVLNNNKFIAHRVIQINNTSKKSFLLKGDNNVTTDGWVDEKNISGVVLCASRYDQVVDFKKQKNLLATLLVGFYSYCSRKSSKATFVVARSLGWLLYFLTKNHIRSLTLFSDINSHRSTTQLEKNNYRYLVGEKVGYPNRTFIGWCVLNKVTLSKIPFYITAQKNNSVRMQKTRLELISIMLTRQTINAYAKIIENTFRKHKILFFPLKKPANILHKINWGSDIDLLIRLDQWSQAVTVLEAIGCIRKNIPPQGMTLISPGNIEVDLHWTIAIPRIHQINEKQVNKLTDYIWKSQQKSADTNELLLLATIVNFWNNDFAKGIGVYQKIYDWLHAAENKPQLLVVMKYAKKLSIEWVVLLVIARSELLFSDKLSVEIESQVDSNWRLSFILKTTTLGQTMLKTSRKMWWYDASFESWPLTLEAHFIQHIIDPRVPLVRLLRPRIIIYLLIIVITAFIRRTDLIWKKELKNSFVT